jgi:hypothetical protein
MFVLGDGDLKGRLASGLGEVRGSLLREGNAGRGLYNLSTAA